jgi:type IV pilus assembly protein PilC
MPDYAYKIVNESGKPESGEVQMDNEDHVLHYLADRDCTILDIRRVESSGGDIIEDMQQVKIDYVKDLFAQLGFLIRSGVPLYQCVEMVMEQVEHDRLRRILDEIKYDRKEGVKLSEAVKKHPRAFTPLHASMITIGEGTGNLDEAMENLVQMIDGELELKEKVKKATAYPLFMLALTGVVCLGMIYFVLPRFSAIFEKTKVKLPATTKFLLGVSAWFEANTIPLVIGTVVIAGGIWFYRRTPKGRVALDRLKFRTPVVQHIFVSMVMSHFARIMTSLLSTGVSLVDALSLSSEAMTSPYFKRFFERAIDRVREGEQLSHILKREKLIPSLVVQLVVIGENSGEMASMMENVYQFYKKKMNDAISRFAAIVEPALLIIMGGVISTVALSILLPMFKIGASVRGGG